MITLDEEQISRLEQHSYVVERDESGNAVSVTKIIDPGPLIISKAEYLRELSKVRGIMYAMHALYEAGDGNE